MTRWPRPHHRQEIIEVSAETEYLISDVEELVNGNISNFLEGQPFSISVTDFMPANESIDGRPVSPVGIDRILNDVVTEHAPGNRDLIGIDMIVAFPLSQSSTEDNPLHVTLKWNDGVRCVLAIVDKKPILLVEADGGNRTLHSQGLSPEVLEGYLDTIGLPPSMFEDDLTDLMGDIYMSGEVRVTQAVRHLLDIATTLEITQDAQMRANDRGDNELVQELCLNIDHHQNFPISRLHGTTKIYRHMLRFVHNPKKQGWEYRGTYEGLLGTPALVDKLEHIDPHLTVPGGKLIDKALAFLSTSATTGEQL